MTIQSKKKAIDARIRSAMHGHSQPPVAVLLVARAILDNIEAPGDVWTVREVALAAAADQVAIAAAREAVTNGQTVTETGWDVTTDAWVCYVAIEGTGQAHRAVCVELLDPYDYRDPGAILGVTACRSATHLPDKPIRQWVLKLSDL